VIKTAQYPTRFVILNQKMLKLQIMDKPGLPPK